MASKPCLSRLSVLGGDGRPATLLESWLSPHGWATAYSVDTSGLDLITPPLPALIVIDGAASRATRTGWVTYIRALDGPAASTPILLVSTTPAEPEPGISAMLPAPLEREATLALIAQWCGPLDDHGFRSLDDPHYRLVRMGGRALADGLIGRFADQLEEALAYLDAPEADSPVPHQIAGAAGLMGYRDIGSVWRAIDAGERVDHDTVRRQTLAAIAEIRRRLSAN